MNQEVHHWRLNIIALLDSEEIEISDFLMDRFAEIILPPLFINQAWRLFKTGSHSCSRAIGCDIIAKKKKKFVK